MAQWTNTHFCDCCSGGFYHLYLVHPIDHSVILLPEEKEETFKNDGTSFESKYSV